MQSTHGIITLSKTATYLIRTLTHKIARPTSTTPRGAAVSSCRGLAQRTGIRAGSAWVDQAWFLAPTESDDIFDPNPVPPVEW